MEHCCFMFIGLLNIHLVVISDGNRLPLWPFWMFCAFMGTVLPSSSPSPFALFYIQNWCIYPLSLQVVCALPIGNSGRWICVSSAMAISGRPFLLILLMNMDLYFIAVGVLLVNFLKLLSSQPSNVITTTLAAVFVGHLALSLVCHSN